MMQWRWGAEVQRLSPGVQYRDRTDLGAEVKRGRVLAAPPLLFIISISMAVTRDWRSDRIKPSEMP
jgi:hypothetical protein